MINVGIKVKDLALMYNFECIYQLFFTEDGLRLTPNQPNTQNQPDSADNNHLMLMSLS